MNQIGQKSFLILNHYLSLRLSGPGAAMKQMVEAAEVFSHTMHYNVTPSQRHLNYAGLQIAARTAFNLQFSSVCRVGCRQGTWNCGPAEGIDEKDL